MSRLVFGSRQYNSPSRFITQMDNHFLDFQGGGPRNIRTSNAPRPSYATRRVAVTPATPKSVVGRLVSHADMGRGVVIEDAGNILTVAFRTRGIKTVARDYLEFVD